MKPAILLLNLYYHRSNVIIGLFHCYFLPLKHASISVFILHFILYMSHLLFYTSVRSTEHSFGFIVKYEKSLNLFCFPFRKYYQINFHLYPLF